MVCYTQHSKSVNMRGWFSSYDVRFLILAVIQLRPQGGGSGVLKIEKFMLGLKVTLTSVIWHTTKKKSKFWNFFAIFSIVTKFRGDKELLFWITKIQNNHQHSFCNVMLVIKHMPIHKNLIRSGFIVHDGLN